MSATYAPSRTHAVVAFGVIQEDLKKLFEYIDPCDANKDAYSFRTFELLLRIATEFESNCKEILLANTYTPSIDRFGEPIFHMGVYHKINHANMVSEYLVSVNIWNGAMKYVKPLESWATDTTPQWYKDYNSVKHNRSQAFHLAKLENVILGAASLAALLYAQFGENIFDPYQEPSSMVADDLDFRTTTGSIFGVKPYQGWKMEELYNEARSRVYNFQKYDFDTV